ncbi:MAG: hypothetical protein ACN4GZ_05065 [Acidimicrobiales bacterium]
MMEKKAYVAPAVEEMGALEELTNTWPFRGMMNMGMMNMMNMGGWGS